MFTGAFLSNLDGPYENAPTYWLGKKGAFKPMWLLTKKWPLRLALPPG